MTPSRARRGIDTRDLSGRTAVVTGGGSGIGRSLAHLLGARGATVHVADVHAANAETAALEVRQARGQSARTHRGRR